MGNYITLDIELEAIKKFLSKNLEAVDAEIAIICEKKERGEFQELDDFSNALFIPMQREAIAVKAVLYEINALVEWSLCGLALEAYRNSPRHATTPKFLGDVPPEEASRIKFVYDLPIGEVHHLIERYYEIDLSNMPGFTEVEYIRKAVNAFKHRKGFKDFRRDPGVKSLAGEKFQMTREDAYRAIDEAKAFLRALWKNQE
jgi:hypothetical protein